MTRKSKVTKWKVRKWEDERIRKGVLSYRISPNTWKPYTILQLSHRVLELQAENINLLLQRERECRVESNDMAEFIVTITEKGRKKK